MRLKNSQVAKLFLACIFLSAVSACNSTPNVTSETVKSEVGTSGQLIAIQSDNVGSAGYDAKTMVMTVQFMNGALYEYYGVPAELWTSFLAAQPHPWSQVGYPRLVIQGVPYRRIK